jgi:hypothetical protein
MKSEVSIYLGGPAVQEVGQLAGPGLMNEYSGVGDASVFCVVELRTIVAASINNIKVAQYIFVFKRISPSSYYVIIATEFKRIVVEYSMSS